jgi:hypothetical protein
MVVLWWCVRFVPVMRRQSTMTHTGSYARLISAILACLACLAPAAVEAQQLPRPEFSLTCPPTMSIAYRKVSAYEPYGAKGKIDGFTPVFLPGSARLIDAAIAVGVEGKELSTIMDDQAPGKLMRWSGLNDSSLPANESAHVKCEYEGGAYLERAVPRPIKTCTLDIAKTKPQPATTRNFISRAVFSCR